MFNNILKLCYCRCNLIKYPRPFSNGQTNSQVLSDLIGLPHDEAKTFLEKHKLQNKDPVLLAANIKYCQQLGYVNEDILGTPALLSANLQKLEQHYLSLEEGGFYNIKPKVLARALYYMRKTIRFLKSENIIKKNTNVTQSFLSYIKDTDFVKTVTVKSSVNSKWNDLHLTILQHFLKFKLNASDEEILRLFRIHKMIKNKSFRVIQENIALAIDLGFEPRKILKYGYLLNNYPNYTKTTLRDLHNLAGADMRKAMRHYPKLMMTSPTNIIKIYGILKEYNIPDRAIQRKMNVFHMSPETVKLRLQEIQNSPDFKVLLEHPRVLSLVVHHNRAKSRLSFLQQLKLKCASFFILETDCNHIFEHYIREGKDIYRCQDVFAFLRSLFKDDENGLIKKIKRHPYYRYVPLTDMQDTYNFLIACKFSASTILKVLCILLYPVEKIKTVLNKIENDSDIKFRSLNQVNQLNLIIYIIEKEHHFTGNGIWRNYNFNETPEKSSELVNQHHFTRSEEWRKLNVNEPAQ